MKIILVNKFYYPKDGVSNYVLELEAQLKALGHQTRIFAMANPRNIPSQTQRYFVSYLSFDQKGFKNTWRAFARIFYSLEAKRKFRRLVKDFRPDIVHVHNLYHQISPSILTITKKAKIPVVMHLHDYKLICPNYKLFVKNKICYRCQEGKYYNCLWNKCLKNSRLKSLGGALEMYFHHRIWPIYKTGIDLFIAPSQFMKKTCVAFGVPAGKIKFLNNFYTNKIVSEKITVPKKEENYLLYFGRLAPEKGVHLIIAALKNSSENLKIAGEGPEEFNLKNLVKKLGLKKQVEFLGFKSGQDLNKLISRAKAVIIPSIWLENMPLNLLEALAYGKIVIAAEIGGIPEIIKNGENGWLFKLGDIADLREKIKQLKTTGTTKMKIAAQATVRKLDPKTHSRKMIAIYQDLITPNKNARK